MAKKKIDAFTRDELVGTVKRLVDEVLDSAWGYGLTESQARIAAEEAAVNWKPPKRKRPKPDPKVKFRLMHRPSHYTKTYWSEDGEWVKQAEKAKLFTTRDKARYGRKHAVKRSGLKDTKQVDIEEVAVDD